MSKLTFEDLVITMGEPINDTYDIQVTHRLGIDFNIEEAENILEEVFGEYFRQYRTTGRLGKEEWIL